MVAAPAHADHVVDLNLPAGPFAQVAGDTGVEIDRDGRMGNVLGGLFAGRIAA